ncbi:MAG: DUF4147 domain-containing protein [Planctomycetales bacterium]|nr:DUF4147 domain-containing protein [Planctomycetales bacterium]
MRDLRDDVLSIWQAGVRAVAPERLVPEYVAVGDGALWLGDCEFPLRSLGRLFVVGGGKAGAGMTRALEQTLGPSFLRQFRVGGIVSVPADCLAPTTAIELRAGRPAGVNEPTQAGVEAAARMLQQVQTLGPHDVCIALLSGGGSALLPLPAEGVSLSDKLAVTRSLSARGATIDELNAVRRELSDLKGGGLARSCRAGTLVSLVLSDVLGDDLATIASGPTLARSSTPDAALEVLERFGLQDDLAGARLVQFLQGRKALSSAGTTAAGCRVENVIIGNNATAVDAAGVEAERRGYSHAMICATSSEGPVEQVAAHLTRMACKMRDEPGPDCLISGGEPTVKLAPAGVRGKGGRNQHLCLAALSGQLDWRDMALASGGTDGEDGPTDAAGAVIDEATMRKVRSLALDPSDYLARSDAYHFFEATGDLIKTGPTHTNVCDVRVIAVQRDGA